MKLPEFITHHSVIRYDLGKWEGLQSQLSEIFRSLRDATKGGAKVLVHDVSGGNCDAPSIAIAFILVRDRDDGATFDNVLEMVKSKHPSTDLSDSMMTGLVEYEDGMRKWMGRVMDSRLRSYWTNTVNPS